MTLTTAIPSASGSAAPAAHGGGTGDVVMSVLRGIRPFGAGGSLYDGATGLTDAGFTSVEMVQVMLGIEAAFDLMIPQEFITPEHFRDADAITSLIERLRA